MAVAAPGHPSGLPRRPRGGGWRGRPLAWLLTTSVALAGCSRGGGKAGAGEQARPSARGGRPPVEQVCALLKPAEIEAVLGGKVGKGYDPASRGIPTVAHVPGMQTCRFDTEDGGSSVLVGLSSAFPRETFRKATEAIRAIAPEIIPVRNLGDEAVSTGRSVLVRQGSYVVMVDVRAGGARGTASPEEARRADRERMATLALDALARLPKD